MINSSEQMGLILQATAIGLNLKAALMQGTATVAKADPNPTIGSTGSFGTPTATGTIKPGDAPDSAAKTWAAFGAMADKSAMLCAAMGKFIHAEDDWNEKITEAKDDIAHTQTQITAAQLGVTIAQQNRIKNQTQIDELQKQIDFLTGKFTNQQLYDWMTSQLSDTYFQSFKLAYRMCKQLERCYQFELGIPNTSFIQFGYWDSLHKGLLAGERLNHDLRRMQSSYLDENRRRFEISRFTSLASLDAAQLQRLLSTGVCDFEIPESLFDHDYPGHYNRHLLRVSITVVYPNPTKFDNVKATLMLVSNKVRVSTDVSSGYAETPPGADPRFVYNYGAVPQKIALGNAQDDPGLFLTAVNNNLSDTRYMPFENAGAISTWHFEMPQTNNEINLANVTDVVLHFFYTALDGGDPLKQAAQASSLANARSNGMHIVSARSDFPPPPASAANPDPVNPWQTFLAPASPDGQVLSLALSPAKFPAWAPGKAVTVSSIGVLAMSWNAGRFVLEPAGPFESGEVVLDPVPDLSEPILCSGIIAMAPDTPLGTWNFRLRKHSADGVGPITQGDISDLFLVMDYQVH